MSEQMTRESVVTSGTAADPIVLKAITQKSMGIDPKSVRKMAPGSVIKLGIIYGVIQGLKMKESNFSDELQTSFIGEFRGVSPEGVHYVSEKAYFFKAMSDKLTATFETGGQKPVEFAYEISSREEGKAQLGYEYVASSLIPTAASDRMTAIALAVEEKLTLRVGKELTAAANATQTPEESKKAEAKTKAR